MSSSTASQNFALDPKSTVDTLGSRQDLADLLRICVGQLWFLMLLA
jgi:hypothetical protein